MRTTDMAETCLELVEISTDDLLITDMKSVVFTERP